MKQPGFDPDPNQPLRSEPVRRDEALISDRDWHLMTMPTATFRLEERERESTAFPGRTFTDRLFVGDSTLWQPLLDALALQLAEEIAQRRRWHAEILRENPQLAALLGPPRQLVLPKPEFPTWRMREYLCEVCGCRYLGHKLSHGKRICVCSNRCERKRRNSRQRWLREFYGPPDYHQVNAARTARRAEARANRVCEHCGVSIEAARSTKRFCSDICRVKAHRASATA